MNVTRFGCSREKKYPGDRVKQMRQKCTFYVQFHWYSEQNLRAWRLIVLHKRPLNTLIKLEIEFNVVDSLGFKEICISRNRPTTFFTCTYKYFKWIRILYWLLFTVHDYSHIDVKLETNHHSSHLIWKSDRYFSSVCCCLL